MSLTYRQAYELRKLQPGAMLPAPFHAMPTADLKVKADRERLAEERKAGGESPTASGSVDPIDRALRQGPPRRPTPSRVRTYFLRVFERCGSVAEAAARAGVTPRTVQRWATAHPRFAERYAETKARRVELLEDLALQRASGRVLEPRFYHGQQVATVERYNDRTLLRVLDRFDRAREREIRAAAVAQAARDMNAEVERGVAEQSARRLKEDERYRAHLERRFEERVAEEVEKRISGMSPSTRL